MVAGQAERSAKRLRAKRRAARIAFFAQLDIWVNVLTVVIQIFLTGRILKWLGVGLTLAMLPAISLVGFLAIGIMPSLGLLALFQVLAAR